MRKLYPYHAPVVPGVGPGGFSGLYRRVFMQLGLSNFLPLVSPTFSLSHGKRGWLWLKAVGQITRNIFPRATKTVIVDWKLSKLGSWSLFLIIWQRFDQVFETSAFDSVKGNNMVFIVFVSIIFYVLQTIISFLFPKIWLNK